MSRGFSGLIKQYGFYPFAAFHLVVPVAAVACVLRKASEAPAEETEAIVLSAFGPTIHGMDFPTLERVERTSAEKKPGEKKAEEKKSGGSGEA